MGVVSNTQYKPFWIFDYDTEPSYEIEIEVNDIYSSMTPPTFTLTVQIVDVEDPPVLDTPMVSMILN